MENSPGTAVVNTKLVLYIVIAILTTMINEFGAISIEEIHNMHIMHWITKFAAIMIPGLVAWRAFIDQSITTLNEKKTLEQKYLREKLLLEEEENS